MRNMYDSYFLDRKINKSTTRVVLFGLSLLILLVMGVIISVQLTGENTTDALVLALGMIPILISLGLTHRGHIELAGALVTGSLTTTITVLATIGQGIYDIGMMAFPVILIVASLILRRNTVIYLTGFIVLCNAWLIFGAVYGIYQPIYPQQSHLRQLVITSLILLVAMVAVYVISNTVHNSLTAAKNELGERQKAESALREAEALYRALVEQTTVVTYRDMADIDGTALYISPQIESLIGYRRSEWTGNSNFWKGLVHPDDLPRVQSELENYIKTGATTISEYRLRTKDNRWVWVRDEAIVIKDDTGRPQYVHGVYIDITEQKTAELKVKQREAILGAVAETAQLLLKSTNWRNEVNAILKSLGEATDASHVYIFENHAGSDGEILSSQKYEWVPPGTKSEMDNPAYQNTQLAPISGIEDWYANLSTGKPFYGSREQYPEYWEKRFKEPGLKTILDVPIIVNGQWWGIIGFDDYVYEMPWSKAEADALIAAASNLGTTIERQQADEALRVSEEKFEHAFHHTYVAMAINRARDHALLDVNEAFTKVTGYSRAEVIGKRAGHDLKIWTNQDHRNFILNTLKEQGFIDEYKAEFRRKNGEVGIGLLSAFNMSIAGEPCHLYTFYDISRMDQLMNELRSKNEELQNFTYTVSHDLKAPLVTIAGFMGYLEQDARNGDTERLNKDVLRITEAVTKMQRLLNELLELSRIGRLINPPEDVSFAEIVQEALGLVEGRLKARQVRVEVDADLPSVYGDRVRLVEVVQNLVENAAKFTGDQVAPLIKIGVDQVKGSRVFYVSDNGMGLESVHFDRVFGLFNKLDANTEGTGIGLALVKRIVEVHGGKVWVESEGKGKGSTIYFTLADRPTTGAE